MPADPSNLTIPYRLRVGVTGHRDLDDRDGIAEAVRRAADQIAAVLHDPERTPLDWTVVSPLAAGADQIVARVLTERHGADLEAPLPFTVDEYRQDFTDPADAAAFDALLARAGTVAPPAGETPVADVGDERDQAYRRVGMRVVDGCELLVAIWDPDRDLRPGGTEDMVQYALDSERIVLWIDARQPDAPARLLEPNRRRRQTRTAADAVARDDGLATLPVAPKRLSPGYHKLNAFLATGAVPADRYRRSYENAAANLRQVARESGLPDGLLDPILERLLPVRIRADALADRCQRRHVFGSLSLLYLSAAAVTAAAWQIIFLPHWPALVGIEVVCLAAIVVSLMVSRGAGWHSKWLHNRFLAEQLRIACFALPLAVDTGAHVRRLRERLPFYSDPHGWLVSTVRWVARDTLAHLSPCHDVGALAAFMRIGWLADQKDWHAGKAARLRTRIRWSEGLVWALFGLTFAAAILHFLGVGHVEHTDHYNPLTDVGRWLGFLAVVLPAWAAAIQTSVRLLEWGRVASRSGEMSRVFARLEDRAESVSSREDLEQVCLEALEKTALENYEWWVLLSFVPPELAP